MVEQTLLDNGLTLLTDRLDGYASATVGCWINVGSSHEPPALNGLTHCIEHLVFRGGRHHGGVELDNGGHFNAFTDKEQTCFFARVMGSEAEGALTTLLKLVREVPFDERLLDSEKPVIIEEIRGYRDNPQEVLGEWLSEAVLGSHPLARSSLGSEQSVAVIGAEALREHWSRYYQTANMLVTAAGHVEHAALARCLERLPAGGAASVPPPPPASFGQRDDKRRRPMEPAYLCVGNPGFSQSDPRKYALALLDTWLAGLLSAPDRHTYAAAPLQQSYATTGIFGVMAACGSDRVADTQTWLYGILDRVRRDGIDKALLGRCRARLKSSVCLALESTETRMMRLARNSLYHGRDVGLDELGQLLDAVTTEEILEVARYVLEPARRSHLYLGP